MAEKVSIVIPFYNCPYIQEAIESSLSQTYQSVEIIVVDDGSTMHQDLLLPYRNQIQYVKKTNGGTASALNAGIRQATGQYFCWLSSDDRFLPEKVEKQLAFMRQRSAAASYSAFYIIGENGETVGEAVVDDSSDKLSFYKKIRGRCPINGCTVMLEVDVFSMLGYFDENLPFTHDYDFWLRLIQHFDFHYFPEPLTEYRHHTGMGTKKHLSQIRKEVRMVKQRHAAKLQALLKSVKR